MTVMVEQSDAELLSQYVRTRSEEAFAELASRHCDWVYSAARRRVGDAHLAQDVTQAVFLLLAEKAARLAGVSLRGWLFKATRYASANALRARARREKYEKKAAMLKSECSPAETGPVWDEVEPLLEETMDRLRSSEREALLLRFYQRKTLAEVGEALGVSEDAAQKRVAAAVERLRGLLGRRGVTTGAGLLAATLLAHTTQAAQPTLLISSSSVSASAGAAGIAKGASAMMLVAKIKIAAVVILLGSLVPMGATAILLRGGNNRPAAVAAQAAPSHYSGASPFVQQPASGPDENDNREKCADNLKSIGLLIMTYAVSNKDQLPPNFAAAAKTASDYDVAHFVCPSSGTIIPLDWDSMPRKEKEDWINNKSDYAYLGREMSLKQIRGRADKTVLVYERGDNPHAGVMNLLFLDAHVEARPLAEAHRLIEASKAAFAP
jgi:RNA polymerase sigma factor (sigma-70 family)